tara:strand:+ start:4855 stop:6231 length:1377 start_codon:yes stop_codon:yes gene_type:complete
MAQTKHTRIITDEQFSKGTTVDGSRLDKALDETVKYFNDMPPSAISSRFVPVDYVMGWMPEAAENSALLDLIVTNDGSGYALPVGDCPTSTSGGGSNMTVDFSVDGSGNINGATVHDAGTGYASGDTVTPTRYSVAIVAAGTGYGSAGTGVATTYGGAGTGLTVDYTVNGAGNVTEITAIRNAGSGYTTGDVLTIVAGDSNATFRVAFAAGDAVLTLTGRSKHHWPWVGTWNRDGEVAPGSSTPTAYLNQFRIKGTLVPGIINREAGSAWPLGSQLAWTTELFFGKPVLFDAINLCLCLDHFDSSTKPFAEGTGTTTYTWLSDYATANASTGQPLNDLQVVVQVADTFDNRIRAKDSAEIQRYAFTLRSDDFSWQKPGVGAATAPGYDDMSPASYSGGTIRGSVVQLQELNIPVHMNAIVRVSVVLPIYADLTKAFWGTQAYSKQYVTMAVTTLEEVE